MEKKRNEIQYYKRKQEGKEKRYKTYELKGRGKESNIGKGKMF